MTAQKLPSPELLRKLLRYEPETGKLFWLERNSETHSSPRDVIRWNFRHANKEALKYQSKDGYLHGKVCDIQLSTHRAIWAMQTGEWPKGDIDHIDRNRSNNAWSNLRAASKSENGANRKAVIGKSSKYLGVYKTGCGKKWRSTTRKNGQKINVGTFNCEIEAAKAYDQAAIFHHGQFANLNFPTNPAQKDDDLNPPA